MIVARECALDREGLRGGRKLINNITIVIKKASLSSTFSSAYFCTEFARYKLNRCFLMVQIPASFFYSFFFTIQ